MSSISPLILGCAALSLGWAFVQYKLIAAIELPRHDSIDDEKDPLVMSLQSDEVRQYKLLKEVYEAISAGASAFLKAEYRICGIFVMCFAFLIFALISWSQDINIAALTTISFVLGAATSIASGYIGMKVAVFSNVRTTVSAAHGDGFKDCFNTAFRAGAVMGFALIGLGIAVMYITLLIFSSSFGSDDWVSMTGCISGFGLGGSTVAMFGRVGGGIYTKAADVGADLVGKVVHGIPEDDPRNPATIADNVGDNVGDVAGMGADLFGSFAESTCAALVIAAQTDDLRKAGWAALCFPLVLSSLGIIVCLACSFLATHVYPVTTEDRIETGLRLQLIATSFGMLPAAYLAADMCLPTFFNVATIGGSNILVTRANAVLCVIAGSVGGLLIGLTTEYYTSKIYTPVKELVKACNTGAATNIIYGLSLGYKSCIAPTVVLAAVVYVAFVMADMYGVAIAAVGMLSNIATCLTIDAYGPVCDNAGGIAEMAELPKEVRYKTDALDAAGNTTAAVGKGFAIGSAALVSLALFGAFVVRVKEVSTDSKDVHVEILRPLTFAFLMIGSMLPYWFSAMTMKSVGEAAMEMVFEVQRQFDECPELLNPKTHKRPDYGRCVAISTQAALREMIAPGALVILSPIVTGTFFGVTACYGLLTGALLSSIQLAISMSNTGGAWDNAKKHIEGTGGKGTDKHKAAVVGDTVGDPLKDTSGPSLNIVMKLMAIISLVFADFFVAIYNGHGVFKAAQ